MQINNYKNSISFSSLNCPIKPFTIKTSKGDLYCSEIDYSKSYKKCFYKNIGEFFLDIFANTSSHPFWKKCRKPTLEKDVYDDYVASSIKDYKKYFKDRDTTVILVKNSSQRLVGAIYSRVMDLGKHLRDKDTLYIDGLAISPEYRGMDVGKKLLSKVLDSSKERFSDVFLVAYKESTPFYEKLKFKKMDTNDSAQKYAIKKLADERIDYPQYVDFMQKDFAPKRTKKWYERIDKTCINKR